jgi:hypothetical protein
MNITNKDIERDMRFILGEMTSTEVRVPSLLKCILPGIAVMALLFTWQVYVSLGAGIYRGQGTALVLSLVIGFIVLLTLTQALTKYHSLPSSVKKNSIVIGFIRSKATFYSCVWILVNITFGLLTRQFDWNALSNSVFQLVSIVIIWFIAIVDLGRYDLALLSSAIKQWREGGDVDASLHKP